MELKNRPIYKGFHKTLCINFRACAAFFPKIMYMSSGQEWYLSVGDNPLIFDFFKMFRSCLFKRFLIKTGNEMKRFLVIGETIVESSEYLKRTGQPWKKISKSFKNILKRYGPLTLPCVVPLMTNSQCPKKL